LWVQALSLHFSKEPQSQDALHGRSAMLRCEVSGATNYSWLQDGRPVFTSERRFLEGGSLKFTAVDRRLDAGYFQCVATSTASSEMAISANASLNIKWLETGPVTLKEPGSVQEIDGAEQIILQCLIDGHPRPNSKWYKDGVLLASKERNLTLRSPAPTHSGDYGCCARNGVGHACSSTNFTLNIIDKTIPRVVLAPKDQVVFRNEEAVFHCHFSAKPPPVLEWLHEEEPVVNKSRVIVYNNGTLRITQVKPRSTGQYRCVARYGNNKQVHVEASLHIAEIEEMGSRMSRFFSPSHVERVPCAPPQGHPVPEVWWERAGVRVPSEGRVYQEGVDLIFSPAEVGDSGTYTCVARNKAGQKQQEVSVTVAEPVSCSARSTKVGNSAGGGAARLPALPRADHASSPGHLVPAIRRRSMRRFQKMPNGTLVISDVSKDDTGQYTCIAGNSCSLKDRVTKLYVVDKPKHTREEEEGKTPYKMIQTVGLSVGAAVAYIIAVLGLMFYCKQRRNAKRLQKGQDGEEPEMECLNGNAVQQNGQTTTEIQEEVALANLGTMAVTEKRQSNTDKLHFPRTNLQTITTLGKGEFGEVFLAKARGIEEGEEETVVLVKSLQSRDEPAQADFRRQADMFSKLSHSNIVRLLGLCRDVEPHYTILEYVDLGDLKQFLRISKSKDEKLKPQPITTKTKLSICAQVAAGMEHLSNQRFVHKDLAARNCLISSQRQVKVSALGLSKDVYNSEYYHHRQAWIPLRWLPVESVFDDDFSTKSDVWAFGVLMWEVFSHGDLPYAPLSHEEVLEGLQASTLKLPAPEGCPSKIYRLMSRCWATSLKERPSFSELMQALADVPLDSKV
ncbi:hypothetical protein P4O66_013777, partial [Electrophorus voltai]